MQQLITKISALFTFQEQNCTTTYAHTSPLWQEKTNFSTARSLITNDEHKLISQACSSSSAVCSAQYPGVDPTMHARTKISQPEVIPSCTLSLSSSRPQNTLSLSQRGWETRMQPSFHASWETRAPHLDFIYQKQRPLWHCSCSCFRN